MKVLLLFRSDSRKVKAKSSYEVHIFSINMFS